MKFKTREEFETEAHKMGSLEQIKARLDVILNTAVEGKHGSISEKVGFKWMLPEVIYYCQDLIQRVESRPTCGPEQRKFLDNVEEIKIRTRAYADPNNPTEYRDLVDLCKFYGVSAEKFINGE